MFSFKTQQIIRVKSFRKP